MSLIFVNEMNPYFNTTFLEFFSVLLQRLFLFITGKISFTALSSDEVQLVVLSLIGASSALLGTFLILRRMTMLANALSHTILIGIVGVFLFGMMSEKAYSFHFDMKAMLLASVGVGLLTTFLTHFLSKHMRLQQDASIGLVFTMLFSLGILLLTVLSRDAHIGSEVVMGNVDALHRDDCALAVYVFVINLSLVVLFYKEYLLTTFDGALATSLGFSTLFFDYLLMLQCSATVVSGFRAVGVLMILALLTIPPLIARLFTHELKKMIVLAVGIGIGVSLIGVALSRHLLTSYEMALSTAGLIVTLLALLFALSAGIKIRRTG